MPDLSADELADALDDMRDFPHDTTGLSMLDEATLRFGQASPEVEEARRAFSLARSMHHRSHDPVAGFGETEWASAIATAGRLAEVLREYATKEPPDA